jgi:hypothetical protein
VSSPRDNRQNDLFRPSLEMIVTLRQSLVRLAAEINWVRGWALQFSGCRVGPGQGSHDCRRGWPDCSCGLVVSFKRQDLRNK